MSRLVFAVAFLSTLANGSVGISAEPPSNRPASIVPVSTTPMAQDSGARPAENRRNAAVVWLEDFGAVPVRGADRNNELHAASNTAALKKALAALPHGGKIMVGPGIFYLNEGVELGSSIWLQGSGKSNPGMATGYGVSGTVFRPTKGSTIPKLFYSSVRSRNVKLSDFAIVGGKTTKDGVVYDAKVEAAVHLIGISHVVDGLGVYHISGDGVWMGDKTIAYPPRYWIFWLRDSSVHFCGGYGIRVETTDGFVIGNYAGNNGRGSASFGGGNIWKANHFDNSHDPHYASLTIEIQTAGRPEGRGAGTHTAEQIVGNYFDVGEVGLRIQGDPERPVNFLTMVSDNYFRANRVLDIHVVGVRDPVIDSFLSNKGGAPGVQNCYSIKFEKCTGSRIIRNGRWDATWPTSLQVIHPESDPITHFLQCVQSGTVLPIASSPGTSNHPK